MRIRYIYIYQKIFNYIPSNPFIVFYHQCARSRALRALRAVWRAGEMWKSWYSTERLCIDQPLRASSTEAPKDHEKCWSPGPNICVMYVGWSTCMIIYIYMFYVWLSPRMMVSTPILKPFFHREVMMNFTSEWIWGAAFPKVMNHPELSPSLFLAFLVVLEDVPSGKQWWLLKIAIYSGFSH